MALVLFAVAFALVAVGVLLLMLSALRGARRVEGGAVLVIGPLPIALGTSERVTRLTLALAIALTLLTLVLFIVLSWLPRAGLR